MLLKYLDIQGFKSFPDKTRVAFGKGLTGVVGPNGSGKSNISDAVRWVLGEQSTKTLRGEKMEDVIFSGTRSRKSQGFAEVSLTVDNAERELAVDSDEVTITRRYDRSGESEYMINRSPVRLRDVHELLMDTGLGKDGYSLIGQGKIAEIIQSKSTERREIFEEAAGISKYRYRKNESERSLSKAEDNLVRLRDILSELEGRVAPLKEQADKAKQFLELSATKKSLEVSLWIDTIEKSNLALKDQSDKLLVCREKHSAVEMEIQRVEDEIQKTFESMQKCLVDMENMRRRKGELEAAAAEASSQVAVCENDILHNEQNRERIAIELADYAKSEEATKGEIQERERRIAVLSEQITQLGEKASVKQQELLARQDEGKEFTLRERELSDQVNALLLRQSQTKMAIATAQMGLSELTEALRSNEQDITLKDKELLEYQRELLEANSFTEELNQRTESLRNACQGRQLKLSGRKEKLSAMKQESDKVGMRIQERQQRAGILESMEQSLEGYAYSVREVVKRSKNGVLSGIQGTVSQLIEVDGAYSTAIETALGGALQNIIVSDEGSAKAAIRLLKQDNLGRATFLPLTSIQGSLLQVQGLAQYPGYVDVAANLVKFESKYQQVVYSLLGRIVIVDDLDTAVVIAQKNGYKFKIVTLDGQVVNAGGSLTGGSRNKSQGFLSRKNEVQTLREEISDLKEKQEQIAASLREEQAEVSRMEAEVTATLAEITTVNEDRIRVQGEQKRLDQLANQTRILKAQMEKEIEAKRLKEVAMRNALTNGQSDMKGIEERVQATSNELIRLQSSNRTAAEHRVLLSEELSALRIDQVGLEKDREAVHTSIRELEERRSSTGETTERLNAEAAALEKTNGEIRQQIVDIRQHAQACQKQAEELARDVQVTMNRRQELEGVTTALRRETKGMQEDKERLAGELVRLDEQHIQIQREYDGLITKLWEEYELTKSEALRFATRLEDPRAATRELAIVRSKIRTLGSVNVDAIEEYREIRERYDFLNRQIKDAEDSRNALLRLIGELTEKMQHLFLENFNRINRQFQGIFVELFGGGRANLRLVDPDNILETGIEIMVEPPGKIINNLAALSGGEQSFVAIAIYFAILKVHPAPFCILDEIEAALDDVNVDKYAAYLRTMDDRTQFIAITHRRGTMEAADVLYGVTMQDEGVSKLLQLKVSDIEEKLLMA